jgi:hypothetical protein
MAVAHAGAASMVDVPCPQCGVVYHADRVHLGKCIKCSRCGSLVPLLEAVRTSVSRQRAVEVVPPAAPYTWRRGWRAFAWAGGVIFTVALVICLSLMWRSPVNEETANDPELRSAGKIVPRNPENGTTNSTNPSGEFKVVELDPFDSKVGTPKGPDPTPFRKLEERPRAYRSLSTGTSFCESNQETGNGILEIENGTTEDAALRLYDVSSEQIIRCLFVKAHDSLRVTGIPEGIYGLKYTTGLDWRVDSETFRWLPSYSRFERQFLYSEERRGNEIQYHEIRVTLHPVIGGNVRTISISREEFLRGRRDASVRR